MLGSILKMSSALAIVLLLAACDPVPSNEFNPPGGFVSEPGPTGRAAIRAVLYTPSHGTFRTVRQAVTTYMGRATDAITVQGWQAEQVDEPDWPHFKVAFQWNDGQRTRSAEWELNHLGIWPVNNEAKVLSVFPPDPR
jgi:hypothetical protein